MSPIYRILGLCLLAQYLTSCHAIQSVAIPSVSSPISSSMLPANVTAGKFSVKNSTLEELDRKVQNGISRWEEPYFANAKNSTSLFQKIGSLINAENLEGWKETLSNLYNHLFGKSSLNALSADGYTPLSKAVGNLDVHTIEELLTSGEKPNTKIGKVYIAGLDKTYTSIGDFLSDMCNAKVYIQNGNYNKHNVKMNNKLSFFSTNRHKIQRIGILLNFSRFDQIRCPLNYDRYIE